MSKKSRKEEQERENPTASAITALLSPMLADHKATLLTEIRTSYAKLESKLDSFQTSIADHQQRISKLELYADLADIDRQTVDTKLTVVMAENAKLKAKLIDLES